MSSRGKITQEIAERIATEFYLAHVSSFSEQISGYQIRMTNSYRHPRSNTEWWVDFEFTYESGYVWENPIIVIVDEDGCPALFCTL